MRQLQVQSLTGAGPLAKLNTLADKTGGKVTASVKGTDAELLSGGFELTPGTGDDITVQVTGKIDATKLTDVKSKTSDYSLITYDEIEDTAQDLNDASLSDTILNRATTITLTGDTRFN